MRDVEYKPVAWKIQKIEKEYKITQNALGERLTFRQFDVVLPKTVQLCLPFVSSVSVTVVLTVIISSVCYAVMLVLVSITCAPSVSLLCQS